MSLRIVKLCSKNEYTKSESNSQPAAKGNFTISDCVQRTNIQNLKAIHNNSILVEERMYDCVQRTNIQNLKAIHNLTGQPSPSTRLCSKNEYTKSESNSQHLAKIKVSQKYCVQRTNIQNLKAIHNVAKKDYTGAVIVFKERIYKI